MASMYAPVSEADAVRVAQRRAQRHAACNTALLAVSAILLATIMGKGPAGDGARLTPSLSDAVPGLPAVLFTDPGQGDYGDWQSMGEGPLPLWYHHPTGRAWADVSGSLEVDLLFVEQVTGGVGIRGMWDVGQLLGAGTLVNFKRYGLKVMLVAQELAHRASDPEVQRSVEQSFADSVLWAFPAHDAADGSGLYVDMTDFVMQDSMNQPQLIGSLKSRGGDYAVDIARSVIHLKKLKSRPNFSCIETNLTVVAEGRTASGLTPTITDPSAITVGLRRSFVQLPPLDGPTAFTPRPYIPKSGAQQKKFDRVPC